MSLTTVDNGMMSKTAQFYSMKNRIINGSMVIDQRNAGASVTLNNNEQYITDRFIARATNSTSSTAIRSTTVPSGFKNSLLITIGTGATAAGTNYIAQKIEGLNVYDLNWGSASAATVTLSFWVRSSLTGTFGGALQNNAGNRSYPFTYTISSANTFEQKSITIAGDQSGTWLTDTSTGIALIISLGEPAGNLGTAGAWAGADYRGATGQTNLVATSGATLYLTGVQLEVGSTATSFDYRPYGTELQLCQRYAIRYLGTSAYEKVPAMGYCTSSTVFIGAFGLPVPMRTSPSLSYSGNLAVSIIAGSYSITSISVDQTSTLAPSFNFNVSSGLTGGQGGIIQANSSASASLILSSEL